MKNYFDLSLLILKITTGITDFMNVYPMIESFEWNEKEYLKKFFTLGIDCVCEGVFPEELDLILSIEKYEIVNSLSSKNDYKELVLVENLIKAIQNNDFERIERLAEIFLEGESMDIIVNNVYYIKNNINIDCNVDKNKIIYRRTNKFGRLINHEKQ